MYCCTWVTFLVVYGIIDNSITKIKNTVEYTENYLKNVAG
jgi:hypothetical protein